MDPAPATDTPASTDGRRQRSARSREKIIRAMWDLMLDGDMEPSAADIAEAAGVGLRSVFRHFEDIDTLYRELLLVAEGDVMPELMRGLAGHTWQERMLNHADRVVDVWDRILVPHTAGEIRRFKSDVLMDDYKRARLKELAGVKAILPNDVPDYDLVLLALDNALSFATVRRLRQDRGLSVKKTKAALRFMVQAAIDQSA